MPESKTIFTDRHSGQAEREPESSSGDSPCDGGLDSRPGLLSAGVTFFRGNDEPRRIAYVFRPLRPGGLQTRPDCWLFSQTLSVSAVGLSWCFPDGSGGVEAEVTLRAALAGGVV